MGWLWAVNGLPLNLGLELRLWVFVLALIHLWSDCGAVFGLQLPRAAEKVVASIIYPVWPQAVEPVWFHPFPSFVTHVSQSQRLASTISSRDFMIIAPLCEPTLQLISGSFLLLINVATTDSPRLALTPGWETDIPCINESTLLVLLIGFSPHWWQDIEGSGAVNSKWSHPRNASSLLPAP